MLIWGLAHRSIEQSKEAEKDPHMDFFPPAKALKEASGERKVFSTDQVRITAYP